MTDYSLTGPSSQLAVERGLANAEWFAPTIDADRLRDLQVRTNGRAAFDVFLWLGLLVASGVWAYTTIWSWWSIPAFAVYGALYGGAAGGGKSDALLMAAAQYAHVPDFPAVLFRRSHTDLAQPGASVGDEAG